jgi:CheY-like chemotaxis protein
MSSAARILLIEDDPGIVMTLRRLLRDEGYEVLVETRGDAGLARAQGEELDVVLTDLKLPGLNGLDLVRQLHANKPRLPVIMMTAHGTTESAIEATKAGAYDYLLKPFEMPELLTLVAKGITSRRMMTEPVELGATRRRAAPRSSATAAPCRPYTRRLAASPPSPSTFSSAARPAPARSSSPAPYTSTATAPRPRSSPSTAPPSLKPCSKANSSAMSAAPSPAPRTAASAASSRPTTAPSSSMR